MAQTKHSLFNSIETTCPSLFFVKNDKIYAIDCEEINYNAECFIDTGLRDIILIYIF